jgi:flagellar hook-length control protein FliK
MMLLAQMTGVTLPQASGALAGQQAALAEGATDGDQDSDDALTDAAALGLLSLPFAPVQLPADLNAAATAKELLGLPELTNAVSSGQSTAIEAALLKQLDSLDDAAAAALDATPDGSFQLSPATSTQSAAPSVAGTEPASRALYQPVGSNAWADEIGSRLNIMAEQGKHVASLRLSPEHLGPLEIRISIQDDQASVWFGATHADTRAAIEHALPRLRELFAAQGMSLADAGVYREPPREQQQFAPTTASFGADHADADAVTVVSNVKLSLLDTFA